MAHIPSHTPPQDPQLRDLPILAPGARRGVIVAYYQCGLPISRIMAATSLDYATVTTCLRGAGAHLRSPSQELSAHRARLSGTAGPPPQALVFEGAGRN